MELLVFIIYCNFCLFDYVLNKKIINNALNNKVIMPYTILLSTIDYLKSVSVLLFLFIFYYNLI